MREDAAAIIAGDGRGGGREALSRCLPTSATLSLHLTSSKQLLQIARVVSARTEGVRL